MSLINGDIHELWRGWMTRGWFDWESEGYPWWGNLHHVGSWWPLRHEPNVMFLHFNDLKADLPGQVRRLADFVGVGLTDDEVDRIVTASSIEAMRQQAIDAGDPLAGFFRDGARGFFYQGTNQRWRDVLSGEELELYEAAKARVLSPDCAGWLERGGPVS